MNCQNSLQAQRRFEKGKMKMRASSRVKWDREASVKPSKNKAVPCTLSNIQVAHETGLIHVTRCLFCLACVLFCFCLFRRLLPKVC